MGSILDDFFSTVIDVTPKSDNQILIREYKTIPRTDHEPVSLVDPDITKGPWIAGGAALRWFQDHPVGESDIDVFCANAKQAQSIVDRIKSTGRYHTKFESENAVTLDYWSQEKHESRWTIQIITRRYFANMQEVLSNFDITVCQVGTCGNEYELGSFTARDIREKNLRFKLPLQPDAVKRLTKYWTYGYRPVEGMIEAIQNNPTAKWQFTLDEDYQNAF
jgi:hypothetical protein